MYNKLTSKIHKLTLKIWYLERNQKYNIPIFITKN